MNQLPDDQEANDVQTTAKQKKSKRKEGNQEKELRGEERRRKDVIYQLSLFAAALHPDNIQRLRDLEFPPSTTVDPSIVDSDRSQKLKGQLKQAFPNLDDDGLAEVTRLPGLERIIEASVLHKQLQSKKDKRKKDNIEIREDQAKFHDLYQQLILEAKTDGATRESLTELDYNTDAKEHWVGFTIDCITCLACGPASLLEKAADLSRGKLRNQLRYAHQMSIIEDSFGKGIFYILPLDKVYE